LAQRNRSSDHYVLLNAESVKRLVTIATAVAVGVLAVAAWGFPKELGLEPNNKPDADCTEEPCRATGKMTGYQVQQLKQADGSQVTRFPTKLRGGNAWLVAFSLTLGDPDAEQRKFFNRLWGKPAQARLAILDPEPAEGDRNNSRQRYSLDSQTDVYDVRPWFGKKAWFVLKKRMQVDRGQVIALTLPTWAPVLATDLRNRERWRSSRKSGACEEVERDRARETVGQITKFQCRHNTARLLFSALVIRKTPENR
jgi:hypothetical protein